MLTVHSPEWPSARLTVSVGDNTQNCARPALLYEKKDRATPKERDL